MKRLSSLRTTLAPMPSTPMSCSPYRSWSAAVSIEVGGHELNESFRGPLLGGLRDLHAGSGVQHRAHNVVIAGAAADIAFELVADGSLVELAAMPMHDVDRRHDHARRAEAALESVIVAKRRLH